MKVIVFQVAAVACAATAGIISYDLYREHVTGQVSTGVLSLGCETNAPDSAFDCRKVTTSRWAVFPFGAGEAAQPGQARKPGVPVAMLGWFYFTMLTIWLVGVGRPSYARRGLHWLAVAFNAVGLAASLGFVFIMATKLDAWCLRCLATHVLNAGVFVLLVLMRPRRITEAGVGGAPEAGAGAVHPAARTLVMTGLTMFAAHVFINGAHLHPGVRAMALRLDHERNQYKKLADTYLEDGKAAFDAWFRRAGVQIASRPDDPVKVREGQKPLPIVVFSDFECPQCAEVAKAVKSLVEPLFDGYVKLTFKHYPICTKCNRVAKNAHPYACDAAYFAEAARLQGKFWEAHDWLFANQNRLKSLTTEEGIRAAAKALSLDPDLLIGEMNSEEVVQRVMEDVEEGVRLKVSATPVVYMEGKPLNNYFETKNPRFWHEVARAYWYDILKKPPPEHVKKLLDAGPAPVTRGSPDPKAGS
ncbi:MAG: thioredoxin domain-containing protein [Phycisphaerae bacterium]|nr:MAG: hypothetical protein EDS66_17570 [Planctomycetota bacterium]KAB2950195.1 MAG: thioredoxin domain-containing protein [Phycisphaerae bacterium]MBE7456203.1 thioredoxin domain-containing protein [Planctomycetia bacterium]MCK6466429.1 thioredoxin domain-containing protein [Phycisphaerae bacterium]MCL4720252.1 thioredoxin domain-containing protein [Phycisphaerae bacterium]